MSTESPVPGPLAAPPEAPVVISVDAMGGDRGPAAVVAGLALSCKRNKQFSAILHGDQAQLERLVRKHRTLAGRVSIRHTERVVTMQDKPAQVMRSGKGTSMWSAVDAVRDGEAQAVVSCGNTGALMAVSMLRLRKLPGVNRPAIAVFWPSRNKAGHNVLLDVGADIRADEHDLLQYALMGASYARNALGLARPRVGLLNVGTEDHKGRPELRAAQNLVAQAAAQGEFEPVGFVEGTDLPSKRVDVIVTDGFTGNVALKTAEGTATLISEFLREAFKATPASRFASLLAYTSLKRLRKRMDPRRVNGGVFLGLGGTVVKSHGSADATGVAAAIDLAVALATSGFTERLRARVAHSLQAAEAAADPAAGPGEAPEPPQQAQSEGQR